MTVLHNILNSLWKNGFAEISHMHYDNLIHKKLCIQQNQKHKNLKDFDLNVKKKHSLAEIKKKKKKTGYKGLVNSLHKIFNFQTCVVQHVKSQVTSVRAILSFFQIIFLTAFFGATKSFIQLFSQIQW